ncbi:F-box domain-containing protein [Mycena chlorophos]|uniref:F-box domain-containing protein n=1 Tax=Mycena chlorophos TaxID=658473 RepID=A0A8H6THH2_MYCCL|nr:F-box domain-containing protein [Mycena chlorophos]
MSGTRHSARLSGVKARKDTSTGPAPSQTVGGNAYTTSRPKDSGTSRDDTDEDEETEMGKRRRASKKQKLNTSRAKSGKQAKKTHSTRTGKRYKDCLLAELPLDVLFEVFGRCPPQDLISLSRTNHLFRTHLLSKASRAIWKAAREYADGPPVGPGMTEQRWAHILFGKPRCQSCNAPNVHRVDYGLQRRACVKRLKSNLVATSLFTNIFPDLDSGILGLLRYTNFGAHSHGEASTSRFYWRQDVEDMALKLERLDLDIKSLVPEARKKKDTFIADRTQLVEAIVEHAQICLTWTANASRRREDEKAEMIRKRFVDIHAKFVELGYANEDIDAIKNESTVRQTTPLSDRHWKLIRSPLEERVRAAKIQRLSVERLRVASKLYDAYKQNLNAGRWRTLPQRSVVFADPAFKDVLESENYDANHVTEADFAAAVASLPEIVASIQAARSAQLLQLIQRIPISEYAAPGDIAPPHPHPQAVDSALAVFVCERNCRLYNFNSSVPGNTAFAYIGPDEAAAHQCEPPYAYAHHFDTSRTMPFNTVFELSGNGVRAAAALVRSVGLEENKTTCAEMDALDARFLCQVCMPKGVGGGGLYYPAYSWRSAIIHFVSSHADEEVPRWDRLDDARAEFVKHRETDETRSWACNHCAEHIERCDTVVNVIEHVKTKHGIVDPTASQDLVRLLALELTPVKGPQLRCGSSTYLPDKLDEPVDSRKWLHLWMRYSSTISENVF